MRISAVDDRTSGSHRRGQPTQLAFFLPHLGGGGTEKVVVTLANGLSAQGYAVDMVLVRAEGVNRERISKDVRVIAMDAPNTYFVLPRLVQYLRAEQPSMLISALDLTNLVALMAHRLSGVRALVAIRIENMLSVQRRAWWKKRLERILVSWLYPRAEKVIAVSRAVADDASRYTGMPRTRIDVIYNPVLEADTSPVPSGAEPHPWFAQGCSPVILGVGRLTAQKDFATLIKAFALVRAEREARLMILGEGDQRDRLHALAGELRIDQDTLMPGFVENAGEYMKRCSVFVLSSIYEGLPTVLIEALASGCPVVSTDCPGGSREILADGAFGLLVPPSDPRALAEAICAVLNGARKEIDPQWLSQFSPEHVVAETIRVLGLSPQRS